AIRLPPPDGRAAGCAATLRPATFGQRGHSLSPRADGDALRPRPRRPPDCPGVSPSPAVVSRNSVDRPGARQPRRPLPAILSGLRPPTRSPVDGVATGFLAPLPRGHVARRAGQRPPHRNNQPHAVAAA